MLNFKDFIVEAFKLTLRYHKTLNPKIWKNDQPKDGIRDYLIGVAKEFAAFSGVSPDRIKDVIMTGGNTNFNYTKFSDIDVHLMCDISGLDSDALYDKKVEWTFQERKITLEGYPVEFYVQDDKTHMPKGQGVYSLLQDKWEVVPKHLDHLEVLNDEKVAEKIKGYIKYIRKWLLKDGTEEEITDFKQKLWKMRSAGLESGGEFSVENVIYKDLRNRGLIDKLNTKLNDLKN